MTKILFILRNKSVASPDYTATIESGVALSTYFLATALQNNLDVQTTVVGITDPSDIPHVVNVNNPTHVVIETFWIEPDVLASIKFQYPTVKWIVRDHSESCFRVFEPNAFGWIVDYLKYGFEVMSNSPKSANDVEGIAVAAGQDATLATYGPNVYPIPNRFAMIPHNRNWDVCNIGCFGAVRPMKNHITQAIAAVMFANEANCKLRFHINGYDIPGYIDPVLNNLRNMFKEFPNHELVEHGWMTHGDFLTVLDGIDICSQVSFTETFNIVAADAMSRAVPIIASPELPWIGYYAHRSVSSAADIAQGFMTIWTEDYRRRRERILHQRADMETYCTNAIRQWESWLCFDL